MNVSGFHFDVRVTDMAQYDFVAELEVRFVFVGVLVLMFTCGYVYIRVCVRYECVRRFFKQYIYTCIQYVRACCVARPTVPLTTTTTPPFPPFHFHNRRSASSSSSAPPGRRAPPRQRPPRCTRGWRTRRTTSGSLKGCSPRCVFCVSFASYLKCVGLGMCGWVYVLGVGGRVSQRLL